MFNTLYVLGGLGMLIYGVLLVVASFSQGMLLLVFSIPAILAGLFFVMLGVNAEVHGIR